MYVVFGKSLFFGVKGSMWKSVESEPELNPELQFLKCIILPINSQVKVRYYVIIEKIMHFRPSQY